MAAKKSKRKKVWTQAERAAFAAKMKRARAAASARRGGRKKTTKKTTRKVAKKTARRVAKKTSRRVAKKTAKKTARRVAKKTAKKTARKVAKKTATRVAKKVAKRRLTGAALKRHEDKLRREAYGKLGRTGPRRVTAKPGTIESLSQQLKIARGAKKMADTYARATKKQPKRRGKATETVTAKDIIQAKPRTRESVTAAQAITGRRSPIKLKTRRAPILGPRKFTALTRHPKVWACAGPRRTGCGGGKKGGHVVGILR